MQIIQNLDTKKLIPIVRNEWLHTHTHTHRGICVYMNINVICTEFNARTKNE